MVTNVVKKRKLTGYGSGDKARPEAVAGGVIFLYVHNKQGVHEPWIIVHFGLCVGGLGFGVF